MKPILGRTHKKKVAGETQDHKTESRNYSYFTTVTNEGRGIFIFKALLRNLYFPQQWTISVKNFK